MEEQKILVSDLADAMLNAMDSDGYSKVTIWREVYKYIQTFVIYSQRTGDLHYWILWLQKGV